MARPGRRDSYRGILRKSRGVYAVITDFSLQLQRSEKTGTDTGSPLAVPAPVPVPRAVRGAGHTIKRDRSTTWEAVRLALAPVPAEPGRGCARASSLRRMPRCTLIATVPALRCAPRSGHLGDEFAAMAYTCARSTRPGRRAALPGNVHARVHRPAPRGSGRCSHGIHAPRRGGLCGAVRHGSGCRSAWRPLEPTRTQGARYALGRRRRAGRAGRAGTAEEPRGRGRQNGWASRPPTTKAEADRRTRDAATRRMSDGAGSRLGRHGRP